MVGYQNYSQPLLQEEEHLYRDIVQGAFEDTYDNNIFKTLMIYKWIVEFCDSVDYILFVDDDYLVNVDNILDAN
jgi:acyl carrier protein phosphodiesterase